MHTLIAALAIKAITAFVHNTFVKVDRWAKRWLTTVHAVALTALLACVILLDWTIATGNAVPAFGAIISFIDAWLGPVDEIVLATWPTYRVCYEVAARWVRWFEAKGLELPQGLKELATELEANGDEAHKAIADKVETRVKTIKPRLVAQ